MKLLRLLMIFLLLFSLQKVFADDIADDNTASDDAKVFHLYDGIDLIPTVKFYYAKPKIFVKYVYPQLQSEMENDAINQFNDQVTNLVQDEISKFQNRVNELQTGQTNPLPKSSVKNDLYIDYDTSALRINNHHIISIRFVIQAYISRMAHPYHTYRVINYDLDNNTIIQLDDIFEPNTNYLAVIADYASTVLQRRLSNVDLIAEGTAPTAENYKNWNIKPRGLLFTFDEAQVAPYVDGAQTVLVPYSALRTIVSPSAVIAGCVRHQKRCLRNNLLTGGFIDEASNMRHRTLNPRLSKV